MGRFRLDTKRISRLYQGDIFNPIRGEKEWYGASHFGTFEAHHVLPCFSDPDLKVKINFRVVHQLKEAIVISNLPMKDEPTYTLQTSAAISISSYAFAIGPYHRVVKSPSMDQ